MSLARNMAVGVLLALAAWDAPVHSAPPPAPQQPTAPAAPAIPPPGPASPPASAPPAKPGDRPGDQPAAKPGGNPAMDKYLGGSSAPAAAPSTDTPAVTVGEPARVDRIDERTVRLDGSYVVRGSGTEDDPYQVTWELLGSVRNTVDAGRGQFVIPGRVADLRGAWIRISGHWAPPVQAFEAREALVMLNKWDGCCIGLPPTPFDSIEAKFAAPVKVQGQHLFRFGTFKGRLMVEPFVAGTFLLGLYRLEQVVMESSS